MTTLELMDHLAEYLKECIQEYKAESKTGRIPVEVYAGYPPVMTGAAEMPSFVYALVTEWQDADAPNYSSAKVEIGFSIQDQNPVEGWKSLFNLMEHVRQALCKKRTLAGRNRLVFPVKGEITDDQPFPQWQGKITAGYTLGQPVEEEINYEEEW